MSSFGPAVGIRIRASKGNLMTSFDLGPAILFVPADRPDRYAKAYQRSDAIIIDLEDAVSPQDRPGARQAVHEHLTRLDPPHAARTVVRVNPRSEEHTSELQSRG